MAGKKRYRKHTEDSTPDLLEMIDVISQDFRLPEEYSEAFEDYIEYRDKDEDNKTGGKVSRKKGGKVSRKSGGKIMYGYKAGGRV